MEKQMQKLLQSEIRVVENCPLSEHSTFRIGGPARFGIFPKSREELLMALKHLSDCEIPFWVIGNGSNLLFPDEGFSGAVLFTSAWRQIDRIGDSLVVSAGVLLPSLSKRAAREGLSGLEFANGIPGTVGGAVFMNAGAYGSCMEQVCTFSRYFDLSDGTVGELSGAEQGFDVRMSLYQREPNRILLEAGLLLSEKDPREIEMQMSALAEKRKQSQPLELPSAGSIFKRPVGHFAGKLIEDCGLKGVTVGGAQVSEKHAGFIVNRGGATAYDVRALIELIQERVRDTYGVDLEPEIRIL